MDVQAEAVVPPHDVAEVLVVAPVVGRVDDALVAPRAPRMRPGRTERDAERSARARSSAAALASSAAASAKVSQRPVFTSISEAMSSPARCSSSGVPCDAA